MTDEEMAEERATKFMDINFNEPDNYGSAKEIGYFSYKAGFLAGLKAGKDMAEADLATVAYMQGAERHKPKWHFVSKEGFPNKDDIYLTIRKDGLHLGDYCCGGDGDIDCQSWCDYPSEEEIQDDSVIAWCEIPQYTEE